MMDNDGYFWFVGRADDVIISSGFVHFAAFRKYQFARGDLLLGV